MIDLNSDQKLIHDSFARFCNERIIPCASEIDEKKEFPTVLFSELADLGFFGLRYPEKIGGSECDLTTYCIAVSEIARGSLSLAAVAAMQSLMGTNFLYTLGSDEIQKRLLMPALKGEKIGTICITEPDAGSDLSSLKTSARKVDGGYELSGQKMWITSAPVADFFTVFARTGDENLLSIFLVEKGFKGIQVGKSIEKMGVWASPTSEVSFDSCFVPQGHLLGKVGEGESALRSILTDIRIMTGALALGVAQAALDDAAKYSAERSQFGKPINRFQAIQIKLADMSTNLEAATHLLYHAAKVRDEQRPCAKLSAQAKLFATEAATDICDQATRILGSYGFAMEYPVQRYFRDIRFTLYGGGTSEILKSIIAREISKEMDV